MSSRRPSRLAQARKLRFESLEDRRVLAGNITALLSGANLLITGDNAANDLLIEALPGFPGRVVLTPQANAAGATTLNGQSNPLTLPSFGDIRISLGNGDDALEFAGDGDVVTDLLTGSLVIDGGRGNNAISVSNYNIGGSLVVRNSTGDDTVALDNVAVAVDINVSGDAASGSQTTSIQQGTSAGRDLLIAARGGDHNVEIGDASGSGAVGAVQVGRNLTILNYGTAANTATINLHEVNVARDLTMTNLSTAIVSIGTATGTTSVGRNTSIRNGQGDNSLTVQNGSSLGTTTADRFALLNGAGSDTVVFNTSNLNAVVDIRNGNGTASVTADDDALFVGALSINNGNGGDHTVTLESATIGSLTVFNGTGDSNTVAVGVASSVVIAGRVAVTNGNVTGDNRIEFNNATIGSPVTLTNGTAGGTNVVYLGTAASPAFSATGRVVIFNGNGDTDVELDNATIGDSLSITNGTATTGHTLTIGEDGLVEVGSDFRLFTFGGDSTNTLDQLTVDGDLYLRTGAGDDVITLAGAGAAGVTVAGATTINTGSGDDTVVIGDDAGTATFIESLTVLMGFGADLITIGANTASGAGTALGDGFFLFDGGGDTLGTNSITIDGTVIDPFVDLATFSKFRNLVILVV